MKRQIERLLDKVEEAVEQRDWQLVRQVSYDVLILEPTNVDAQLYLSAAERASRSTVPTLVPEEEYTESPSIVREDAESSLQISENPTVPGLRCLRCGYVWVNRRENEPIACANKKCRSKYWNKPRRGTKTAQ